MKALRFEGSGGEYFKIWIVNILLIIVTLGLYYPWAKVRTNRYFYANSTLEDRNFEYHATGEQLFIAHLVTMILLIAYLAMGKFLPIGSIILGTLFFLALPWILWKGMQFRMRMTSFSNVRFDFAGALGQSYLNYLIYPVMLYFGMAVFLIFPYLFRTVKGSSEGGGSLLLILGGLIVFFLFLAYIIYAFAFLKKKNTEFKINGLRYGQGVFESQVTLKRFAYIILKTIIFGLLVTVAIYLILVVVSLALVALFGGADLLKDLRLQMEDLQLQKSFLEMNVLKTAIPIEVKQILIVLAGYFVLIPVSMLIYAYPAARNRAYIYDNTKLDNQVAFASTLKVRSLAWVKITNIFALIFTLGLAYPWTKVRLARLMLENTHVNIESRFDDYMTQQQKTETSLGDQIGDAFNIDMGIGF